MSDNGKEKPEEVKPEEIKTDNPSPKELTLIIKYGANGFQIQAPGNGQVYDEPMSFWLLDKAKDIIKAHNIQAQSAKVIHPHQPNMAQRVRGMFRK